MLSGLDAMVSEAKREMFEALEEGTFVTSARLVGYYVGLIEAREEVRIAMGERPERDTYVHYDGKDVLWFECPCTELDKSVYERLKQWHSEGLSAESVVSELRAQGYVVDRCQLDEPLHPVVTDRMLKRLQERPASVLEQL